MAGEMSTRSRWLWHLLAAAIVVLGSYGLYIGSEKVDYTWRWQRVPQYLVSAGGEEVPAPFDATVAVGDDGKTLTLTPLLGGKTATVGGLDVLQVADGEVVFKGNTIGKRKGFSPGPLLKGLWLTLWISFVSLFCALILGLLIGLARVSKNPAISDLASLYVELIRGTPLLVQLYIVYYFIGDLLKLSPEVSGIAALSAFTAAYIAEIIRSGIQAVPKGQTEAAQSLGLSGVQTMAYVILPQAMRRILPPLAGQFINLIKDSSLVSVIALTDLTKAGREVVSSTFSPFEVWFTVAAMYLVLTGGLSWAVRRLEKRLQRND
jgi:polar amino acid transport system permease protein